ncbi:MAG TPA: 1,4-alpha-glucan branching protein domain-containing protein [Tepidisphaeraceae bacterium]|nr:1,4-alpha-glucan branching protein domain-containing protein [Tepidisphaeraceae bacterium]
MLRQDMAQPIGSLCIVLHAHLPYVLHHGTTPHGEAWLYEAMAETYLPLLDVIGEIALNKVQPALTIGLTPILLEQLASRAAQEGFVRYLNDRIERARLDAEEFTRAGDEEMARQARRWEAFYEAKFAHFQRIGGDICRQFELRRAEGHIQIIGGAATHAYLPLLLTDQAIAAQLAAGAAVTRRLISGDITGLWLPECAYRPATDQWRPPVLDETPRYRRGLETFLPCHGFTHFFVDSPTVAGGQPLGVMHGGQFHQISNIDAHHDKHAGWRDALEPVGVASEPGRAEVAALARHPSVSEQVWSSKFGYPGDGAYLEFHKKHGGGRGLRYWRVTDVAADLGSKKPYDAAAVAGRVYAHAQHFCRLVKEVLQGHHQRTGRTGVCVAAFDAELFGHWWFEGIGFLRNVILSLAAEGSVRRLTTEAALIAHPPDKIMRLAEGSWGKRGDHSVWLNAHNKWMWEVEYRSERKMIDLVRNLPWQTDVAIARPLQIAARQLLLMQASDWPFVVESGGAVDYGMMRFAGHATRFDRCAQIAEHRAAGLPPQAIHDTQIAEADAHDGVFADVNLQWWR